MRLLAAELAEACEGLGGSPSKLVAVGAGVRVDRFAAEGGDSALLAAGVIFCVVFHVGVLVE